MDNLEYLNHIAQSNRPTKAPRASASNSLILKILLGGLALFVVILLFGLMLGGNSKTSDLTKQLYVRTTNLNSTLTNYNSKLKSSKLRAIGISLTGTLTNASSQLSNYLTSQDSGKNALVPNTEISTTETDNINSLTLALENAKLNGILDRTYVTQVQLQVSLLLSMVNQLSLRADDEALIAILDNFLSSLAIIDQSLRSYSNPSD